jgi:hypothetical protein
MVQFLVPVQESLFFTSLHSSMMASNTPENGIFLELESALEKEINKQEFEPEDEEYNVDELISEDIGK